MNQPLPPDLQELEQMLSSLVPCALDTDTADRLADVLPKESCLEADEAGLDELEKHLCQLTPVTMRTDVLSRMISAMDSWHEHIPVEEKVVAFSDESQSEKENTQQPKSGNMVAAAAAVALLGAATALIAPSFFPEAVDNPAVASIPSPAGPAVSLTGSIDAKEAWLVPDAMSHKVLNTSESSVVLTRDSVPHRCIRLDGVETIKIEDEDGREITINRPSVQYVLIPVETN